MHTFLAKKKVCAEVIKNKRNKSTIFPTIPYTKWKTNLNIEIEHNDFLNIFENMYKLTKDTKLLFLNINYFTET